eukprot:7821579-Lingulodinium_polyedra.AAC.1
MSVSTARATLFQAGTVMRGGGVSRRNRSTRSRPRCGVTSAKKVANSSGAGAGWGSSRPSGTGDLGAD